jgi:hypothetical protein
MCHLARRKNKTFLLPARRLQFLIVVAPTSTPIVCTESQIRMLRTIWLTTARCVADAAAKPPERCGVVSIRSSSALVRRRFACSAERRFSVQDNSVAAESDQIAAMTRLWSAEGDDAVAEMSTSMSGVASTLGADSTCRSSHWQPPSCFSTRFQSLRMAVWRFPPSLKSPIRRLCRTTIQDSPP